jgi:drug/metabolite transporter (DMT)-like permease
MAGGPALGRGKERVSKVIAPNSPAVPPAIVSWPRTVSDWPAILTGRGLSALVLSTGQLAAGVALLALVAPVVARDPVSLTPTVLASVLVLGVLGTGVAYVLNYQLIADEGAVAASTVTYLIPVVAVVLGALILNEPLTWNLLVGAVIVLVGVAVAEGRFGKVRHQPVLPEESERERTG